MGLFYENLVRPALFRLDPEKAHDYGRMALATLSRSRLLCNTLQSWNRVAVQKPVEVFGLKFPNAVGLAAGMDKNGEFWRACGALGFGHVEIGTITHRQQPGNPTPRLFRYPAEEAVINRMGFNNDGAEEVARRLKTTGAGKSRNVILGINLGKSKVTPLEEAAQDYVESFRLLAEYADYITINVSSPNTPGLRKLQEAGFLEELLSYIQKENQSRAKKFGAPALPILVKIAPDLNFRQIDSILAIVERQQLSGIIATNTTLRRPGTFAAVKEDGGLSGKPLFPQSYEIVKYIALATRGRIPIIAVGGIHDARTAGAMLDAGATLIQIYSAMVYRGPMIGRDLALACRTRQLGFG